MSGVPPGLDMLPGPDVLESFLAHTIEIDSTGPATPLRAVTDDLAAAGVGAGVPVLIAMPNGIPLLTCFFAVLLAGGVPVQLAAAAGSTRVTTVARSLGAGALVAPRIDPTLYGAGSVRRAGDAEVLAFPWPERRHHAPGDVILMTSGTSGIASGCLHGVDALLRNASRHAGAIGQRQSDTVLLNLPLHFSYALVAQALAALVTGSRLVVTGPPFSPGAYVRALADHQVTVSSLTPTLITRLDGALRRPLRVLTVGGDALAPRHVAGLRAAAPLLELYLTYGLTEAGPRVATLAAHREPPHRYASVGLPLPGVRTRLRPAAGAGGGACELLVESDTVLRRRVPEHRGDPLLGAGTIATGDLFEIDEDGYHYFKGRLSDSVVVNGEKVWLPSVREMAASIPGVQRTTTRVYEGDDGQRRYDLDVFVHDPDPRQAAEIERTLRHLLLRGERPHRITLRPVSESGWHK